MRFGVPEPQKCVKLSTSSIPTLKPSFRCTRSVYKVSLPPSTVFLAARKSAARILILCGWALQTYSAVGHCRDTWWLGTAGILCSWALQGYLVVEHCRDTLQLGSVRILCGWALQGYSAVGHCRDTWWLSTAWILGGWSRKSASSQARTTSTLKSNHPTARVGNNGLYGYSYGFRAIIFHTFGV